ncbi:hypothetical protein ACUH9Y_08950 [Dermabacteraceae bacterium P13115]
MNRYGRLLMSQWKIANPEMVANLEDAEAYFSELGERAMREIGELETRLLHSGQEYAKAEGYLEMIRAHRNARMQAEEIVLSQHQPPSDMEPEEDEDNYV